MVVLILFLYRSDPSHERRTGERVIKPNKRWLGIIQLGIIQFLLTINDPLFESATKGDAPARALTKDKGIHRRDKRRHGTTSTITK